MSSENAVASHTVCPRCAGKGKRVGVATVRSLVNHEVHNRIGEQDYRVCDTPACDVVYFAGDESLFLKSELTVRVGIKESKAPRPVCYCFDHSIEEIEREVADTGRCTVLDDIKTRMTNGCWCETKNPLGCCCLATVGRFVNASLEKHGHLSGCEVPSSEDQMEDCCATGEDCCSTPQSGRKSRAGIWSIGAVLSAVLASACCWLPLLLITFGVSAVGVSAVFETVRPYFLATAAILLAAGFYVTYFRKAACGPNGECATPNPRIRRFNRSMLWIATLAVAGFGLFPNYVGVLAEANSSGLEDGLPVVTLDIDGMTCDACAVHLRDTLVDVPGVECASVSYANGQARVGVNADSPPSLETLVEAVSKAGYVAKGNPGD